MKVNVITIEPEDMAKYEVTVTGGYAFAHRYHWRVRLAIALLRLAGWIGGIDVNEEMEDEG